MKILFIFLFQSVRWDLLRTVTGLFKSVVFPAAAAAADRFPLNAHPPTTSRKRTWIMPHQHVLYYYACPFCYKFTSFNLFCSTESAENTAMCGPAVSNVSVQRGCSGQNLLKVWVVWCMFGVHNFQRTETSNTLNVLVNYLVWWQYRIRPTTVAITEFR